MRRLLIVCVITLIGLAGAIGILIRKPYCELSTMIAGSENSPRLPLLRAAIIAAEAPRDRTGSTFTDQLVRSAETRRTRGIPRLARIVFLRLALDARYSKDQILAAYMDRLYLGRSTYGVSKASLLYFGKSAADLTPAECAFLAGLIRSPRYISADSRRALERRNYVLSQMRALGFIDQSAFEQATRQPLGTRN